MAASPTAVSSSVNARITGLPPVEPAAARVLVLGSMPGIASLRSQQYYAHPRNLFWPLMQRYLAVDAAADYARRITQLAQRGVALWDVLASCHRPGSLDSAIKRDSERANPVPDLLCRHPALNRILLNGGRARDMFHRHLAADCMAVRPSLDIRALPSTSPANQSIPLAQREAAWAAVIF